MNEKCEAFLPPMLSQEEEEEAKPKKLEQVRVRISRTSGNGLLSPLGQRALCNICVKAVTRIRELPQLC